MYKTEAIIVTATIACYVVIVIINQYCENYTRRSMISDENTLKFLVIGDWGGMDTWPYYTYSQLGIAYQMARTAEEVGADFTVSVGDNFYSHGVKDVDDPRFKATFEVSKIAILIVSL